MKFDLNLDLPMASMLIQYVVVPLDFDKDNYSKVFFVSADGNKCDELEDDLNRQLREKKAEIRVRTVKLTSYLEECFKRGCGVKLLNCPYTK